MGDFLGRLFGLSDNSDLEALMRQQQAMARQQTDLAIETQRKAQEQAAAALVSPADTEAGRLAGENIMRRRKRSMSPELAPAEPAPVSYKMLMGS